MKIQRGAPPQRLLRVNGKISDCAHQCLVSFCEVSTSSVRKQLEKNRLVTDGWTDGRTSDPFYNIISERERERERERELISGMISGEE